MSELSTKFMLEKFQDAAPVPGHYLGQARTVAFKTQEVEIDIKRDDSHIAVGVYSLSDDGRKNESTLGTNKKFLPAIFKEDAPLTAEQIGYSRSLGTDSYKETEFQVKATDMVLEVHQGMRNKIMRACEIQACQAVQTGIVDLVYGDANKQIDFKMKSSHKPTASIPWGNGSEDKIADVLALLDVVRQDGHGTPVALDFGPTAWRRWLADLKVQALLDIRHFELGLIKEPEKLPSGAVRHGRMAIGEYVVDLFSYSDTYRHPTTGTQTRYLGTNNVVARSNNSRFDMCFGAIHRFGGPDPNILPYVPERVGGKGFDLFTHAFRAPDALTMNVQIAGRPLFVPVGIDTVGCLTTV